MLLTITTTHQPATDLGHLLHKHPGRCQSFALAFGQAHVFYPEASPERCTAALLLDVDPLRLSRREQTANSALPLEPYVNDCPYVASSFLSVAIAQVFGSALAGHSKQYADLAATALPLQARLSVLPCRAGADLLHRLFAPLGYTIQVQPHPLDDQFPQWGNSPYWTVNLQGHTCLRDLLTHLYVLIPVLDDRKHYWVDEDEVEKLLRQGGEWLAQHPERTLITHRYLKHQHDLTRTALARLTEEDQPDPDSVALTHAAEEAAIEAPLRLHEQRLRAVVAALADGAAWRVLDLGCGEGQLLKLLLDDPRFTTIVGMDVAPRVLERAQERLQLERLPSQQRERITLLQGSLVYRDKRLAGYDGAAVVEVIEHLDPPRLALFERVLFGAARPGIVVITTPNAEYNVHFPRLPAGHFRHKDHRFEWGRAAFQAWAQGVAQRWRYSVTFQPIGPADPTDGAPTQMAVFRKQPSV